MSDKIKVEEEEVQIKDFLQSIQKVMKIKADNTNIELHFETTKDLPKKLLIDPNKVTQILYNLIDNAIKHTPENGKITVDCNCKETGNNRAMLFFSVKDNGAGMPQTKVDELLEADKLLEIYSEENPDDKKRQLGMAIVTMLVKTMDGKMNIQSSEGEGSTFDISIPVKIPKQLTFNEGDKPDIPLKILLVEDHFLNQIATKKVLTTWSDLVSVDIAENGLIGLEKFREHGYDLVLMDLQMPVMTGIESSKKIREKSNVPIIALTANSSKQEADKCFEAGINDYIAKPFQPQDLYAKIMNQLITVAH
jgi:CheY-like chemotaxis protein